MDRTKLLRLFRKDQLAARDGSKIGMLKDWEVVKADLQGLLVGTNGCITLTADCSKCVWKEHVHFDSEDLDEVEEAYGDLTRSHKKFNPRCTGEVRPRMERI